MHSTGLHGIKDMSPLSHEQALSIHNDRKEDPSKIENCAGNKLCLEKINGK